MVSAPLYTSNLVINAASDLFTSCWNNISGAFIHALNSEPEFKHLVKTFKLDLYVYMVKILTITISYVFTHWLNLCPGNIYYVY